MQRIFKTSLVFVAIGFSFLVGYSIGRPAREAPDRAISARKPLYYQDPMHPAYRSDKPGIAPDCGMQLEPVYADPQTPSDAAAGSITLTPQKRFLLGLRTAVVSNDSGVRTIRAVGKIAADESRVDRVSALADGVVRKVSPFGVGSMVHKDDLLATYFVSSRDLFNAMQAFFLTTSPLDQNATTLRNPAVINTSKAGSTR